MDAAWTQHGRSMDAAWTQHGLVLRGCLIGMHWPFASPSGKEEALLGNGKKQRNFSIFQSNMLKLEDSLQNAALEISDAALQNILTQAAGASGDSNG